MEDKGFLSDGGKSASGGRTPGSSLNGHGWDDSNDREMSTRGAESLPEVRFTHATATGKKVKKAQNGRAEDGCVSDHESMSKKPGTPSTAAKSAKKVKKVIKKEGTCQPEADKLTATHTESLPEVRKTVVVPRRGRVVPSRYKESAKSAACATPVKKKSDASCISINQSKLFSTATASTPNSSKSPRVRGRAQDTSGAQSKALPRAAALSSPDKSEKENTGQRKLKAPKSPTVKVKPMRAKEPIAKVQVGERLPEHEILYNQYLQWQYLCRMTEDAIAKEMPQMNYQARQLSQMVEAVRRSSLELERKLQAVTLYRETCALEADLSQVLTAVNGLADSVRGDLNRLTTTLDATRNRLQLKSFTEPTDVACFVEELTLAAERSRDGINALVQLTAPNANLLQHAAEAVSDLNSALQDTVERMGRSGALVEDLSSLTLQEASLTIGSSIQSM